MAEDFDPYYRWLGIPSDERPPDHYRLLGIRPLEADREIIRTAAEQRTAYLRTFQLSQQVRLSERILNEIAAAQVCLLDPMKKAEYDARLRRQRTSAASGAPPPVPPPVVRRALPATNRRRVRIAVGAAAILVGVLLGVSMLGRGRDPGEAEPLAANVNESEPLVKPSPATPPEEPSGDRQPKEDPAIDAPAPPVVEPDRTPPVEIPPKAAEKPSSEDKPAGPEPPAMDVDQPRPDPPPDRPKPVAEKPRPVAEKKPGSGRSDTSRPDRRVEQFRAMHEAVRPLFGDWEKLDKEVAPLRTELGTTIAQHNQLQQQSLQLQRTLRQIESAYRSVRNDPEATDDDRRGLEQQYADYERRLFAVNRSLQQTVSRRTSLETQIRDLGERQANLIHAADQHYEPWISLCDPLGRLGQRTHQRTLEQMGGLIREEPRIALPYLARGFSLLRLGKYALAVADLATAESRDARLAALCAAARGYALSRQGNARQSGTEFGRAMKLNPRLGLAHALRGYAYMEKERYTQAEKELRLAVRHGQEIPEVHDALARLLATCPHQSVRDGKQAVEHATKACELTEWKDWRYLNTLAAAYAETGQFDQAVRWATKAVELAPPEDRAEPEQRLGLFQAAKPFRGWPR